jgi:DNA-directed RNA polymerase subunit RPC12/RpoP
MMLPGLGITWEWTRWLLRNLGHAFSFAPYRGLFIFSPLTHGSRRGLYSFAASRPVKIVAPFSRKGSSSDQTAAGTRCRFCGSKPVLKRRAIFGTRLGRWEPRGSSTDLAHITTLLGSFKIRRFRVCATTFILRDDNWSRALLGLSGPESRTHT